METQMYTERLKSEAMFQIPLLSLDICHRSWSLLVYVWEEQGFWKNDEDLNRVWLLLAMSWFGLFGVGTGKMTSPFNQLLSLAIASEHSTHSRDQGEKSDAGLFLSVHHLLRVLNCLSLLACGIFLWYCFLGSRPGCGIYRRLMGKKEGGWT